MAGATPLPIKFDRLDRLLTKVVTVGSGHMYSVRVPQEKKKALLLVYAQTALAVAILTAKSAKSAIGASPGVSVGIRVKVERSRNFKRVFA
jgi:hypothetical protein